MMNFHNVKFNGTFRSYQQKVLDDINIHVEDKKIHIVAAPGSGKTILGLELIRRLNTPALILSPTVTIRSQWKDRFQEKFLSSTDNIEDYFSLNIQNPKLLTSITYQSLYSAFHKLKETDDFEEPTEVLTNEESMIDYQSFNLLETFKKANIQTICLDEAHHLRSKWQKSLEEFIEKVKDENITIISLTATPPYDSSLNDWNRYINLCGEIDEEIFVPELVNQKTLCPHQDYIYFNYPTEKEMNSLLAFKACANDTTLEILNSDLLRQILNQPFFHNHHDYEDFILENAKGIVHLLTLAEHAKLPYSKKVGKLITRSSILPKLNMRTCEIAFQFVIDYPDIFSKELSEALKTTLSKKDLFERGKVTLESNEKTLKILLSSAGKLDSICKIVEFEQKNLNENLRMVILTDYIKKNMTSLLGTNEYINTVNTVTIFESIRRQLGNHLKMAILSGSLVIVKNDILDSIQDLSDLHHITYSIKPLKNLEYSEIIFNSNNKCKVTIINELLEKGKINILIGTKSLLGEGWDSPCINTLILASFVGSYMLSNQMRGRAIRTDKNNPNKTANIWHLTTIEPQLMVSKHILDDLLLYDKNKLISQDYEMLERRFNAFLAPSYTKDLIESGIERLDVIQPPYNKEGIETINQEMLKLAMNREVMFDKWVTSVQNDQNEIIEISKVPSKIWPKRTFVFNIFMVVILNYIVANISISIYRGLLENANLVTVIPLFILATILSYYIIFLYYRILKFISPLKSIKTLSNCVLSTLKEIGFIRSNAKVKVKSDDLGILIHTTLVNATVNEKNIFSEAISEMLSSVDNPRYLFVKSIRFLKLNIKRYFYSYSCPSMIGAKKEYVEILKKHLEIVSGSYQVIYTRNDIGRKILLKARNRSYLNLNNSLISRKKTTKNIFH